MDKKGKIWNKNYILLLQGQLVSTIGDSLYSIALAFFVLKLTGSTALVGMIMGIVTIPRIILGPFAAANKFWAVVVCFILAFMFQIVFNMLLNATVMVNTPENMRGKVSAVKLTLCMAASPVGNFIGGFIAEAVSPRMGIIYSGAIAFVIAFIILCKKDIRQFMS